MIFLSLILSLPILYLGTLGMQIYIGFGIINTFAWLYYYIRSFSKKNRVEGARNNYLGSKNQNEEEDIDQTSNHIELSTHNPDSEMMKFKRRYHTSSLG